MNFKEICDLFGGQTATSRILGKSSRFIRRVASGQSPIPNDWMKRLAEEAKLKSNELLKFYKENVKK